ncbi:hypothetical protein [Aeromicrobium sp. 179-A 4D2 NHS]|uniref:hypothetical protein n=1 Tax=Aeromicrobium sp. 179-A 4D2 NHS TaxID=3142375 RepID=UPI0039A318D3
MPVGTNGNSTSFAEPVRSETLSGLDGGMDVEEGILLASDVPDDLVVPAFGVDIKLTSKPVSPVFLAHCPERDVIVTAHVAKVGVLGTPSLERTLYSPANGQFLTSMVDSYTADPFSAADIAKDSVDEYLSVRPGEYTHDADPTTLPPATQFADTVEVDGHTFHRRREGVYPSEPYAMRFEFDKDISDEDMGRFSQLVGYAYAASVRGERMPFPERDSSRSFVIWADTTKSRSDDLGEALDKFEKAIGPKGTVFAEGSPIRTTDRAGAGTKGTRLVEGFGHRPNFEIYYDSVV